MLCRGRGGGGDFRDLEHFILRSREWKLMEENFFPEDVKYSESSSEDSIFRR